MSEEDEQEAPQTLKAAALNYVAEGAKVLTLVPGDKTPLTPHGVKDATDDPDKVDRWWQQTPKANIGICTGAASGVIVIDVDVKNDAQGKASLAQLEQEHGPLETLRANTPSGGEHLYFLAPGCRVPNRVGLLPGIDVRGDAGYIVAPPSVVGGKRYGWQDETIEIAEIPETLLTVLTAPRKSRPGASTETATTYATSLAGTGQGGRNDLVFRLACRLRQDGLSYEDAEVLVRQAAGNCTPPLPAEEAERCLDNAWGYVAPAHLTDLGNAERLVGRHGNCLRQVVENKVWLVWDGYRWREDTGGAAVHRLAKETVRSIRQEAEGETDEDRQKAIRSHATKSESKSRIDAMVSLAAKEPGVPIRGDELDTDDLLLGVQNGVVDLRDGSFRAGRPEDLVTKSAGAAFDPAAGCPLWLLFLATIFPEMPDVVSYLQRVVGYLLTGLATERVFFIFHGDGANGKSTVVEVLRALLGDYALQALPETFMATKWQRGVNNDIARLAGARFASMSESEEGQRLAEGLVKNLTGGDTVTARFLFREYSEFRSKFKLLLATNHLPEIRGTDPAIWDRLHLVKFPVSISPEERDQKLRQKLLAELPGILNWAVAGCLEWQRRGLRPPEAVANATQEYREELDLLDLWLAERTVPAPQKRTRSKELYADFKAWLEEQGEDEVSHRQFGERMIAKGVVRVKSSTFHYLGIALRQGE